MPNEQPNKQTTVRVADLERRVAEIEQWVRSLPPLLGARGCVCPVGSEATCKGLGCPRREMRIV